MARCETHRNKYVGGQVEEEGEAAGEFGDSNANPTAPASALQSDQEQEGNGVNGSEGQQLLHEENIHRHLRPRTRECYVALERIDNVSSSRKNSAADGGLSVEATSTHRDISSSSGEDSGESNQEDKRLKYQRYNYDHIKIIATNPTIYQCEICKAKFKTRDWRSQHDVCKNGLKNMLYKCQECNRGFVLKSMYETHLRVHSGVRPFPCSRCGKRFKLNSNLSRHIRQVHLGERRPHTCQHYGKRFRDKRHQKTVHAADRKE